MIFLIAVTEISVWHDLARSFHWVLLIRFLWGFFNLVKRMRFYSNSPLVLKAEHWIGQHSKFPELCCCWLQRGCFLFQWTTEGSTETFGKRKPFAAGWMLTERCKTALDSAGKVIDVPVSISPEFCSLITNTEINIQLPSPDPPAPRLSGCKELAFASLYWSFNVGSNLLQGHHKYNIAKGLPYQYSFIFID